MKYPFGYSAKLKMMFAATRDPRLLHTDDAVYSVLVNHANKVTGLAFPAVSTIVKQSGVPKSTVLRALERLESAGYFTSTKRKGANSKYQMTCPAHGTSLKRATGVTWNVSGSVKTLLTGVTAVEKTGPADGALIGFNREKKEEQKATGKNSLLTFDEFMKSESDAATGKVEEELHRYADIVGMPHDYPTLAFTVFSRKFRNSDKRLPNWWTELERYIRGNWLKLWEIDRAGNYYLTTSGKQAAREGEMDYIEEEDRQRSADRPRTERRLGSDQ